MATSYHLEALRRQRLIDKKTQSLKLQTVDHDIPPAINYKEKDAASGPASRPRFVRPKSASSIVTSGQSVTRESERQTGSRHSTRSVASATSCSSKHSTTKSGTKSVNSSKEKSSPPVLMKSSPPVSIKSTHSSKTDNLGASKKSSTSSRAGPASSAHSQTDGRGSQQLSKSVGHGEALFVGSGQHPSATTTPASALRSETTGHSRATKATNSRAETQFSLSRSSRGTSAHSKQSWTSRAEIRAEEVRRDLYKQELVLRDSNLVMGEIPLEEEVQMRKQEAQQIG